MQSKVFAIPEHKSNITNYSLFAYMDTDSIAQDKT